MSASDGEGRTLSTARGTWSVVFATAAPVVGFFVAVVGINIAMTQGTLSDPRFGPAMAIAGLATIVVTASLAIAASILGVASVVHARPYPDQPKRKSAMVRGWIGIGVSSVLLGLGLLSYLLPLLD